MNTLFEFIGGLGLILISIGVILKNRRGEDVLYVLGGICLEGYSIYLHNTIFIILQIVFVISALYDMMHTEKK